MFMIAGQGLPGGGRHHRVLGELGTIVARIPEVADFQSYAGTSAPINFNGLVRQYYLRAGGELGDLLFQIAFVLRLGEEAQVFAVKGLQDPLPVIRSTTANVVRRETGSVEIHWTPKAGTLDYLFATTNFNGWDNTRLQPTGRIGIDSFINQYQMVFFKFFQVDAD